MLLPFWYESKWCTVDESVLNSCVLLVMPWLYRTWTRALGSVGGLPLLGEDGVEGHPGATQGFAGLAVLGGRGHVLAFSSVFWVSSLTFPSFW